MKKSNEEKIKKTLYDTYNFAGLKNPKLKGVVEGKRGPPVKKNYYWKKVLMGVNDSPTSGSNPGPTNTSQEMICQKASIE